jgi:hypothetical protein
LTKHNKSNGVFRRNFGKRMRKDLQIRLDNVTAKPALLYGSECWTHVRKTETELTVHKWNSHAL